MFWSDYKDQKGFGVFDTQSNVFKFVTNPNRMFHKLTYDDTKELNEDFSNLKNKYIKIVVVQKTNPQKFDTFMDDIYKMNPIDVTIVEDVNEMVNNEEDVVDQAQDTLTILSNYIDQQTIQVEPQKLKTVMRELYLEALSSETIE